MWPFRHQSRPQPPPDMWGPEAELASWLIQYYRSRGVKVQADDTLVLTIEATSWASGVFKRVNHGSAKEFAGRIEQALAMVDMVRIYPEPSVRLANVYHILMGDESWRDPPQKLHAPVPFQ